MKIGFLSTLTYFSYFPFWEEFLEDLGAQVITSPYTSREILDMGTKEAVSDACIPIKVAHGHVLALKNQVDFIFLPRMISVEKWSTFCPKFLGLPDMIKATFKNIPPLIEVPINLKEGKGEVRKSLEKIGSLMGKGRASVFRAYIKARKSQKKFENLLQQGVLVPNALEMVTEKRMEHPLPPEPQKPMLTFAVLGYPYQVFDEYISVGVVRSLLKRGVKVISGEKFSMKELLPYAKKLPKKLFWHYSDQMLWAAYKCIEDPAIDGIIHVTSFGCGPDAMVDKFMELECKKSKKPYLSLTIDEQTGEAGVGTRLEAFIDMLILRREKNEGLLSSDGNIAHSV